MFFNFTNKYIIKLLCISAITVFMGIMATNACTAAVDTTKPEEPDIYAQSAMVTDTTTGEVLFAKNPDTMRFPASLTKIMTAIVTIENGNLNKPVTIGTFADEEEESPYLEAGNVVTVYGLMEQMLLVSDNGAASSIGMAVGGSVNKFIAMMNRKAKEIGAINTQFANCNGLPGGFQHTTARDMTIIMKYAMGIPQFRQIVSQPTIYIPYIKPAGFKFFAESTNELIYDYPGCTGGKTGWTNAAGGCVIVSAQRNGHELICVVLKSDDTDTRFSDARALLNYGFACLAGGE